MHQAVTQFFESCSCFPELSKQLPTIMPTSKYLSLITLNYGGVLKSPFQFYTQTQGDQKQISDIFLTLLPIYIKNFDRSKFQWDIGKIDLKLQTQRYSPLYNKDVGINKEKNELVSAEQFTRLWDLHYKEGSSRIKIEPQPAKNQIQNMRMFDLITYHTFLIKVYKLSNNERLDEIKFADNKIDDYKKFMNNYFSQSFLDEEKKSQKVITALSKVDVAFLQEPTGLLIEKLKKKKEFIIREKGDGQSLIVLRKDKFLQKDANGEIVLKRLGSQTVDDSLVINGNRDCAYICVDNFIFISVHLSSKQEKNRLEVKVMKKLLTQLRQEYWAYHIILGGDINSFLSKDEEFLKQFYVYPSSVNDATTRKKRTLLQPQFKKANKEIESCKDHIISTWKILKPSIQLIDGDQVDQYELLPTDKHPFDHFMVVGKIDRTIGKREEQKGNE